jgi:hypothetical protein
MKKYFIIAALSAAVLPGCAFTQETAQVLATGTIKHATINGYVNDVNTRAMRDFVSRYRQVPDVAWHKNNGGDVAVFYSDSVQHRVVYNPHGYLQFVMKYYDERQMDRSLRATVRSNYYDYKIYIIQEINIPDRPAVYIINLQGETDWKKIKYCQGEMEVMESYKKDK